MDLRGLDLDLDLLRTFYHVAHSEGISPALSRLPYGLTRSAVSQRMTKLETQLGFKVCERQPFHLTEEGRKLLDAIEPMLLRLRETILDLRDNHCPKLSVGGPQVFTQAHWPDVLKKIRVLEPRVHSHLINGSEDQLEADLRDRRVQVVIAPGGRLPLEGCIGNRLGALSMALIVPADCPIRSLEQLWMQQTISMALMLPESSSTIVTVFQAGLRALGVKWPSTASGSLLDVLHFVARGEGAGLTLLHPNLVNHPGVRVLVLEKFPPIDLAVIYHAPASALVKRLVRLLAESARELLADGRWRSGSGS